MNKKLSIVTLIGLVLGIICGFIIPNVMNNISFIGTIYVNLLKFIIIPILITNIITTMYKTQKNSSKIFLNTIIIFLGMFILTFLLTSVIIIILKAGNGYNFTEIAWNEGITKIKISEIIINLFPSNISTMISSNSIFAAILFALFFGICASKVKNGEKVIELVDGLKNIFNKMFEIIMYITPIAVFTLMGTTIANYGSVILNIGTKYIALAYLCGFLTMILIMILPVWIIAKINPIQYIKKVYKVWLVSCSTCSSLATLPTTIKVCNDEFNISKKITDIVVPLGCTIHMCGGAVSFALLGIFCSQVYGIEINLVTYLLMIFSATLINMSAPGISGGGIVIGATYLSILNIPINFIGLYSGIYRILDMNYTTLNVTGDISANIILNEYLERKKIKL